MDTLNIATWNVRGLTDRLRQTLIRHWLNKLSFPIHILILQEIKIDGFLLDSTLQYIFPNSHKIVASSVEGRGGVAILIDPTFPLISQESPVPGRLAWAQIQIKSGTIYVAGVYAPNDTLARTDFWVKLTDSLPRGHWYVAGDFNMTELHHDSTSISPYLSPSEANKWRLLKMRLDILDSIDTAELQGPRFTRSSHLNGRLIQSRLDRIYYSRSQLWNWKLEVLAHHYHSVLSDHDPIILRTSYLHGVSPALQLTRSSYFKANPFVVRNTENIAQLKIAWQSVPAQDNILVKFHLAKQQFRLKYKELQKNTSSLNAQIQSLEEEIARLKSSLQTSQTQAQVAALMSTMATLREILFLQAVKSLKASKSKHTALGDMSSKFFFRFTKDKFKRENMIELKLDTDEIITDESEILKQIHLFYTNLYQHDIADTVAQDRAMSALLQYTRNIVTDTQYQHLVRLPNATELLKVVNNLALNKSPGSDGLTTEVIRACWDFIKDDFLELVHHFWRTGQLYMELLQGIIRIIPKKLDKLRLKDWRPLTMLQVVYKIAAKILANRLSVLLPLIVSPKQSGFVPGRQILNNISIGYLMKDWAESKQIPLLFLLLDFEKAFDRVDFKYLWTTLEKVGLGGHFLKLVQGLVLGATAKVHINGLFTEEIPICRGVRQGDPLAPLLFAIATQPFITYLDAQIQSKRLPTVFLSEDLTVCHLLFADDIGIFIPATPTAFQTLKDCINVYEVASGARLNLPKSVVVPVALQDIPAWLHNTGCTIAQPGVIYKYLGAPFGFQLTSESIQNFCLNRLTSKVGKLASLNFSFTGRTVIVKQVLLAIPTYHLMYSCLPKSTSKQIRKICSTFLWGHSKQGKRKVPLIAWQRLVQSKKHGGLSLKDIDTQAKALLARWTVQLLTDPKSTWSLLFRANLTMLPWQDKRRHNRLGYSFLDKILFSSPTNFRKKPYTRSLWKVWQSLRPHLIFAFQNKVIPAHWFIGDMLTLIPSAHLFSDHKMAALTEYFSKIGIVRTGDLWNEETNKWQPLGLRIRRLRQLPRWMEQALTLSILELHQATSVDFIGDEHLHCWEWRHAKPNPNNNKLLLASTDAYKLLHTPTLGLTKLNEWWGVQDSQEVWSNRLKGTWDADITLKARTFLWKILAQGHFTNDRAQKFGHGTGKCDYCINQVETISHLFFHCPFTKLVWQQMIHYFRLNPSDNIFDNSSNFLELLDQCLGPSSRATLRILILFETTFSIWKTRNSHHYQNTVRNVDPFLVARTALSHAHALVTHSTGKHNIKRLQAAHDWIQRKVDSHQPT
jgi:exonuclease III